MVSNLKKSSEKDNMKRVIWRTRGLMLIVTGFLFFLLFFSSDGRELTNNFIKHLLSKEASTNIENDNGETTASSPVYKDELTIIKESNGLKFDIRINKRVLFHNDEIKVNAIVTNISEENISYLKGSSSCPSPGIKITVQWKEMNLITKQPKGEPRMCTQDMTFGVLQPGETNIISVTFLQEFHQYKENLPAPKGEYDVIVQFEQINEPVQPNITFPIYLNNENEHFIGLSEVQELVNSLPEVETWYKDRHGSAVAVERNGEYFILLANKWEKTTKDLYERTLASTKNYEENIYYENGNWIVTYLSKTLAPYEITIVVDAFTGKIEEIDKLKVDKQSERK
jgi:hypothetical protein